MFYNKQSLTRFSENSPSIAGSIASKSDLIASIFLDDFNLSGRLMNTRYLKVET